MSQFYDPELRMIGFLAPLEAPFKAKAGDVVPVHVNFFDQVREHPAICNLTMRGVPLCLSQAFVGFWTSNSLPAQQSPIVSAPCPHCADKKGISLCKPCGGTKRQVLGYAERSTPAAVANWNALQEKLRNLAKTLRLAR